MNMDFKEIYPSWLFVLCDWADWYEIVSWVCKTIVDMKRYLMVKLFRDGIEKQGRAKL
jgi:hypothetical protein